MKKDLLVVSKKANVNVKQEETGKILVVFLAMVLVMVFIANIWVFIQFNLRIENHIVTVIIDWNFELKEDMSTITHNLPIGDKKKLQVIRGTWLNGLITH